jgi:hypothetical protein
MNMSSPLLIWDPDHDAARPENTGQPPAPLPKIFSYARHLRLRTAVFAAAVADAGYRGHNAPPDHKFKVYTTGQKRRVTPQIKREFKRRAAIEPVIGHLKEHHRMGRNHLAHASGGAINAVLATAGYNFRRLLAWLRLLLLRIRIALSPPAQLKSV